MDWQDRWLIFAPLTLGVLHVVFVIVSDEWAWRSTYGAIAVAAFVTSAWIARCTADGIAHERNNQTRRNEQ